MEDAKIRLLSELDLDFHPVGTAWLLCGHHVELASESQPFHQLAEFIAQSFKPGFLGGDHVPASF